MLGICIHKLRNIDIDTSGEIQRGEDDKYTVVSVMHNIIYFLQFGFPAALHLIVFQSKERL